MKAEVLQQAQEDAMKAMPGWVDKGVTFRLLTTSSRCSSLEVCKDWFNELAVLNKYSKDFSTAWKRAGIEFVQNRAAGTHRRHKKGLCGLVKKYNKTLANSP